MSMTAQTVQSKRHDEWIADMLTSFGWLQDSDNFGCFVLITF